MDTKTENAVLFGAGRYSSPVISTIYICSENGFGQPFSELLFLTEPFIFGSGHYYGHYGSFSSISPAITFAAFAFAFLTAWV